MSTRKFPLLITSGVATATLLGAMAPATAWAEPPEALPENASADQLRFRPAFDYDEDGCYPTPAVGPDGTVAEGLKTTGAVNGNCHDESDLDNTNSYARSKCDGDWCAHMYALYFEKDQGHDGPSAIGHRHDLEHVVVWVDQRTGTAEHVSASAHGEYATRPRGDLAWQDDHPKIVYHKDGGGTHAFRFAGADEQPENHQGSWQYPALVEWEDFPNETREALVGADFGSATLALADDEFASDLVEAKPADITFDPHS